MAGYVSAVLAIVRAELCGQETGSFCDFFKVTSCNFTPFYFFASTKHCFFEMCLVRSTVAKLCPNIHFDALDFSEYRCEEVIGFFWRSVYFPLTPALVYSGLVLDGSTQSNQVVMICQQGYYTQGDDKVWTGVWIQIVTNITEIYFTDVNKYFLKHMLQIDTWIHSCKLTTLVKW